VAQTLASHNLPTNRTRELIKPSADSASLRLEIEKKFFRLGFWVLCVLRHNESKSVHFGAFALPWAPAQCELYFAQSFLDLWLENESYRALDWPASTSKDKIMAQKPSFWQKFEIFKKGDIGHFCPTLATRGWQPDWARELFKPSKDSWSLPYWIKKNFQNFFGPFWSMAPWLEDVLRIFLWCYPRIQRADIVTQSFIGSRTRIRVFRALDRLSSISGSKVRPERPKYFTDLLGHFRGFPWLTYHSLALICGPGTLKKSIKPPKKSNLA